MTILPICRFQREVSVNYANSRVDRQKTFDIYLNVMQRSETECIDSS
jgi:hypothetical protein